MKQSGIKVWMSIFAMLVCIQSVSAHSLKGTVYDSSTNASLSGVIVYHKATANRVITDASGVFSLTIGGSPRPIAPAHFGTRQETTAGGSRWNRYAGLCTGRI